jgi:hypothetical protein
MSRYLICEAHCKLPADNRKSEFVENPVNWSTQDCNNALRMAIMHKLSLRWWSRKRQTQTHRHEMKYAALPAYGLSTAPACEMFWRTRLSRLGQECFSESFLHIALRVRLCAQI